VKNLTSAGSLAAFPAPRKGAQPDTATKPAEEHRSYTTSWDMIKSKLENIRLKRNMLALISRAALTGVIE
jgi:hypothetical protein